MQKPHLYRTILLLLLTCSFLPPGAMARELFYQPNEKAKLIHESSFTLVERIMHHVSRRTDTTQLHQAGGELLAIPQDDGSEIIRFNNLHITNGLYENYRVNGVLLIPVSEDFDVVNKGNIQVTIIYPGEELTYEITAIRLKIRFGYSNDHDYELLSYMLDYQSPTAGMISVNTVEPILYHQDIFNLLSSAKQKSGKVEIHNHAKTAVITVLPTPDNYTWQKMQIDFNDKTYKDEWRYLDVWQFRDLPKGL